MILNIKAKILLKKEVAPDVFLISLLAPLIAQQAIPGQFIHIKCSKDNYPLLRRPLSIHRMDKDKGEIFILFQVVGEGTKLLAQRAVGNDLNIIGPIGNGFNIYPKSQKIMIVGGGIGVAPLIALAEKSVAEGKEVRVLTGASIFTCGPKAILRKIADIASRISINCQVSLEERMGCGIGACLGCVCKIKTKKQKNNKEGYYYKRVCVDGPVFKASEVIWDD